VRLYILHVSFKKCNKNHFVSTTVT
jgi:hypothetical protein